MLQKLEDHITNCLERAAQAEQRAADATDPTLRADNEQMAEVWRHLAGSYQFVESLERFLLDAEKEKAKRQVDPRIEGVSLMLPPLGTAFDPATIVVLAAAYNRAVDGQPASVREDIAKRIIELASEGERDPDKLCNGARALFMKQDTAAVG